jgi:hypothetical protein
MEQTRGWRLHENWTITIRMVGGQAKKYVYHYKSSVSSKIDSVLVMAWDGIPKATRFPWLAFRIQWEWPSYCHTGYYVIPEMGYIPVSILPRFMMARNACCITT